MAAASFPLLCLPLDIVKKVVQNMETLDQITYSLLSKKAKSQVISLNLKPEQCAIYIEGTVTFAIRMRWNHWMIFDLCQGNNTNPHHLTMSDMITVRSFSGMAYIHRANKEGFGVKQWINHMLDVTHCEKKLNLLVFRFDTQFENRAIKEALEGLDVTVFKICDRCSNEYTLSIIEDFHPIKSLELAKNPYSNKNEFHKILNQNFDWLSLVPGLVVSLNDLLFINSKIIRIFRLEDVNWKFVNQFLKQWIGGSNRRMRQLQVFLQIRRFADRREVFKGVKHQVVSKDGLGIFDVKGNDGRKATIRFSTDISNLIFQMNVSL